MSAKSRIMWRCIFVACVVIFADLAISHLAIAREKSRINPVPFAHTPCSVLDDRPCTPSVCGLMNHGPCIPEIDYPIGQDLHLTIESKPSEQDMAKYQKPDHDLDTIADLFAALRSCWIPPANDGARAGMQMSVRFSFKRDGDLIGPPRMTYASPDVPAQALDSYRQAIDDSLSHCAPMSFTKGLGGAIAGKPIMVRFVDNRVLEKTSTGQVGTPSQP
jgi:hypothetical protein